MIPSLGQKNVDGDEKLLHQEYTSEAFYSRYRGFTPYRYIL